MSSKRLAFFCTKKSYYYTIDAITKEVISLRYTLAENFDKGIQTLLVDNPVEYAKEIASRMMCGMPVDVFDEMPQSAIREMTNMMMGRVASLFEKINVVIDITPPTLMTGVGLSISNEITPTLVLGFNDATGNNVVDLDISIMMIFLDMKECQKNTKKLKKQF